MPLLKKESNETLTPSPVSRTRIRPTDHAHGDEKMPVLEKEAEEKDLGPDSSADSGWSSSVNKPPSLAHRSRRQLDTAIDCRRFGYDPREWRVPKLTIRRRRASGQSGSGNSGGLVSSTSPTSGLIYEILPACGRGSVESQPSSDDSSFSDQRSSTTTSTPDSISPAFFYGGSGGTAGNALKRLRLKFGEESVAIDVGRN